MSLRLRPEHLSTLQWRSIGPHRGGRVVAVAGDPDERQTFYFGACAGAASGRPRTAARTGATCPTASSAPPQSARWRWRTPTPRSSTPGWARRAYAARLSRRRRLPVHGRRGDVEARRPRRHPAHRACQGRPARPRSALRRGAGPRLRPERAARGLPLQGRRPHLGARALQEREGRCDRPVHRPPTILGYCTRRYGRRCGRRGASWEPGRRAACGAPRTAAIRGPTLRNGPVCRTGSRAV